MAARATEEERGTLYEEEFLPALVCCLGPWRAGDTATNFVLCQSLCRFQRALWNVVLTSVQVRTHKLRLNSKLPWGSVVSAVLGSCLRVSPSVP